jgi:hypothetical protein
VNPVCDQAEMCSGKREDNFSVNTFRRVLSKYSCSYTLPFLPAAFFFASFFRILEDFLQASKHVWLEFEKEEMYYAIDQPNILLVMTIKKFKGGSWIAYIDERLNWVDIADWPDFWTPWVYH